MSEQQRASFGGKLSAILVAAGSAIGLGSIWRFPYMAGENGGAAFLLVYLLCVFVVGIPVMLGEFAVGRKTQMNAVGGFRALSRPWRWLGYNGVLCAMLISGYYYIVAGWSLEYLFSSFGPLYRSGESFSAQWEAFQLSPRQAIYTVAFVLLTHIIIARGVEKGIEKASKVMMPALFIILIIMAVRVAFMPGAAEGYRFFLNPDFSKAFSAETIFAAIGQAFFSLSVGMGCMVTYASYFKKDSNLTSTSMSVSLLTLLVATLAGLVIFPAVFSAGLEPTEGASLIFITLPEIFKDMPLASLWSAVFFLLIVLAALTSTISFHEVLTAYFAEEFKFSRRKATNLTSFLSVAFCLVALWWTFDIDFAGIKVENISFFDIFDYTTANVLMPLGGLLTCIFVAWWMKPDFLRGEMTNYGALKGRAYPLLQFTLRYFTPLLIAYIFIKNLGLF
ncbi:MAG: sodium-dependent transporter [Alistipes sp.]|nr:sodium-dependent transporter [Alistipes sp.]